MKQITINIPISVNYYREEDKTPAAAMAMLIEKEMTNPDLHEKLTELVETAKTRALEEVNRVFTAPKN